MSPPTDRCPFCGGAGVIRCANVYRSHRGKPFVTWELAAVVPCGCRYREAS